MESVKGTWKIITAYNWTPSLKAVYGFHNCQTCTGGHKNEIHKIQSLLCGKNKFSSLFFLCIHAVLQTLWMLMASLLFGSDDKKTTFYRKWKWVQKVIQHPLKWTFNLLAKTHFLQVVCLSFSMRCPTLQFPAVPWACLRLHMHICECRSVNCDFWRKYAIVLSNFLFISQ